MLLTTSIILLGIGLSVTWIGFKAYERVYGIALLFTGVLVVVWSLTLAPLGFQLFVELLLLGLINFFSNLYVNWSKTKHRKRCYR
jgi:hypothetical protein